MSSMFSIHTALVLFAQSQPFDRALSESKQVIERNIESIFNIRSVLTFVICIVLALILGRVVAAVLRRATNLIGRRADKTQDLGLVTRLRRLETLIVLSIAIIRIILVLFAIYFWWILNHAGQQPTALLGAGAVLTLILSGALSPVLRDVAYGAGMMAEHWYGVGDHISVDPIVNGQGIVERVTLRSTRLRSVTGEIVWINNQSIWAVHVTPKGVRTIAIELFVSDLDKAIQLIDDTNLRLPIGAIGVVSPLAIMTQTPVGKDLWHITTVSEAAPGREWLLDNFAIKIMQELDSDGSILIHEPISRYADSEAERKFARTINNARKSRAVRRSVGLKSSRKKKFMPPPPEPIDQ